MPNYFVFIVSGDTGRPARTILSERMAQGLWPLNARTPHQRDLAPGDSVLIYAAASYGDPDRHCFLGSAQVVGSLVESSRVESVAPAWLGLKNKTLFDVPVAHLRLFPCAVPAQALLPSLSFVRNKAQWGSYFQGGIRKLPREDYDAVMAAVGLVGQTPKCSANMIEPKG